MAEAIANVHLIMVVTPSFTHRMIAERCHSALTDGQVVVLNPGRTGGALDFLNTIRSRGCHADITIAETQTLIYSCRKTGPASVEVFGVKKEVALGAFPANRIEQVLKLLHPYYPQFTAAKNCMETSLSNIGALFHPTPVLLNIGRIENDRNGYRYYWDGITPSVALLINAIDRERMAVARAYGVEVLSAEEWLRQSYDTYGNNLYELIQHNDAYADIKAPNSIEARYVTEDVPMSLVPISELAHIAGVPTPNIDAVVQLTSSIYQRDFRVEGRCARALGIEGMSKEQVLARAKELFQAVDIPEETQRKFPAQLSGGEAQRVGIVRALINLPEILFADEPTGALNSKTGLDVLDTLTRFNEQGQSVVMVTHDMRSARRGNRILYLKDGVILGECNLGIYVPGDAKRHERLSGFLQEMGW